MSLRKHAGGPDPSPVRVPADPVLVAWGAGLFEGEGCYTFVQGRPIMTMNLTDEDTIRRFTELFGGNLTGPFDKGTTQGKSHWKPQWNWTVSGLRAVWPLAIAFFPHHGERRQARSAEIIQMYINLRWERAHKPRLPRRCRARGHLITSPSQEGSGNQCLECRRVIRREAKERAGSP